MTSTKPLSAPRLHFCRIYVTNGHNGAQAYKEAYPNAKSGHDAHAARLIVNDSIKQEIARIDAKTEKKTEADRQYCIDRLQKIAENKTTTDRNQLTALSLIGDFTGAKRDKAPNTERVAQVRARMSAEELRILTIAARIRCDELADGPKLAKDSA